MSIRRILQLSRARRATAAGLIVLSLGGLALVRSSFGAGGAIVNIDPAGSFAGQGMHGSIALSHGLAQAGRPQRVFAELRLRADAQENRETVRAPLSLVVVLDTSGSMMGDKMDDAKRSVLELIDGMDDSDQIALVRYDNQAELVQPLARVGRDRSRVASA